MAKHIAGIMSIHDVIQAEWIRICDAFLVKSEKYDYQDLLSFCDPVCKPYEEEVKTPAQIQK